MTAYTSSWRRKGSSIIAIIVILAIFESTFVGKEAKNPVQSIPQVTLDKNATMRRFQWKDISMQKKTPSCLQLDESLPLLISELERRNFQILRNKSNPISFLSPINIPSDPNNHHGDFSFDGLTFQFLSKVFRGKKVVLIGDSTIRLIYVALREMLSLEQITDLTFDENFSAMIAKEHIVAKGNERNVYMDPNDGTHLEYISVMNFDEKSQMREQVAEGFNTAKRYMNQPDIIIFNAGLHLLHLIGQRKDPHTDIVNQGYSGELPRYQTWLNYEALIREYLDQSIKLHPKAILIKTTNRICSKQYSKLWLHLAPGDFWVELAQGYDAKDPQVIDFCTNYVKNKSNGTLTSREIQKVCTTGVFTKKGSRALNVRLHNLMAEIQAEDNVPKNLTLGMFPDDELHACAFTKDARHYKEISPSRITLLANILDCIL